MLHRLLTGFFGANANGEEKQEKNGAVLLRVGRG